MARNRKRGRRGNGDGGHREDRQERDDAGPSQTRSLQHQPQSSQSHVRSRDAGNGSSAARDVSVTRSSSFQTSNHPAFDRLPPFVQELLTVLDASGPPKLDEDLLHDLYLHHISEKTSDPYSPSSDALTRVKDPLSSAIFGEKLSLRTQGNSLSNSRKENAPTDDADPKSESLMPTTSTPSLDQFLQEISALLRERNGVKLASYLLIEPPYPAAYEALIDDIKQNYAKDNGHALENKLKAALPEARDGLDGTPWSAFTTVMITYFGFLRDVDIESLLHTYRLLSNLVSKCNSALKHASMGAIILPTVVAYSRVFARLAAGLEKQPELIAHEQPRTTEGEGARETLSEKAANVMRQALVLCLKDKSPAIDKPQGKQIGIYAIANICLKILFNCHKIKGAETIIASIQENSPPLELFPASERVTYLYYVGRYWYIRREPYPGLLALETAYRQCRAVDIKQRRLILIFLMAASLCLGRFPSQQLYSRPEAEGLAEKFQPICQAIAKGDLTAYRQAVDWDNPNTAWFLHYRIFIQLRTFCELLIQRSLIRKTFLLCGDPGDAEARKAPTLNFKDVHTVMSFLESRALVSKERQAPMSGQHATSSIFGSQLPDPLKIFVHPEFEGIVDPKDRKPREITGFEIESTMSGLIAQGFLNGFLSHRQQKFAIQGAVKKGALEAGFPTPWEAFCARMDDDVPGWVKK
ncbi:MAG: hypothetical protein Q9165_001369 [Trypethelium subeluteriae]